MSGPALTAARAFSPCSGLPLYAREGRLIRRSPPPGRRWALGCSSHLPGVATDVPPGLCESHNPRWSPLPDGRLPLCQGLHKLGTAAGSLLVWTTLGRAAAVSAATPDQLWKSSNSSVCSRHVHVLEFVGKQERRS